MFNKTVAEKNYENVVKLHKFLWQVYSDIIFHKVVWCTYRLCTSISSNLVKPICCLTSLHLLEVQRTASYDMHARHETGCSVKIFRLVYYEHSVHKGAVI